MKNYHHEVTFWLMIVAIIAHSLNSTMFSFYGFLTWFVGSACVVLLYFIAEHRKKKEE